MSILIRRSFAAQKKKLKDIVAYFNFLKGVVRGIKEDEAETNYSMSLRHSQFEYPTPSISFCTVDLCRRKGGVTHDGEIKYNPMVRVFRHEDTEDPYECYLKSCA